MGKKQAGEHKDHKQKTPTFLLELPLQVDWSQEGRLRTQMEAARCLYNALLSEAMKRLRCMRNDPAWNKARALPRSKKQERTQAFSALQNTNCTGMPDLPASHGSQITSIVRWLKL